MGPSKGGGRAVKKLWFLFFLPLVALMGQQPSCNQSGSLTSATTFTRFANNTANPICDVWVLAWSSTGFSALSIQLPGSNDNSTYTAFSGATTVLAGTNPGVTLSGAMVIQATSTNAYVQVKVNSITGSGAVNF